MATTQRLGIDIGAVNRTAAGFAAAQRGLDGMTSSVRRLQGVFAALAGSAVITGVARQVQDVVDRMDVMGKSAQKVGMGVAELSKLEYAAELSGVAMTELEKSVAKLAKAMGESAAGANNNATKALAAMGIAATDANGKLRSTGDVMAEVADRFASYRDGAAKTALAVSLFGEEGIKLIPMLNGGRAALKAAGDELQQFGGVVTPEAARQAEVFNDNMTRLRRAGGGLAQELTQRLLPTLIDITEAILGWVRAGDGLIAWVDSVAASFNENLLPFLETTKKEIDAIVSLWNSMSGLFSSPATAKPLEITINGGNPDLYVPQPRQKPIRQTGFAPLIPGTSGSGAKKKTDAERDLERVMDMGKRVFEETRKPLEAYQMRIAELNKLLQAGAIDQETYNRAVVAAQEAFAPTTKAAEDLARTVETTLTGAFQSWIEQAMSGTFKLKDAVKQLGLELMRIAMSDIFKGGGTGGGFNLFGGLFSKMFGGFGGFYADGGRLGAGQWGIAGEAGPEIIMGPATVVPVGRGGGSAPRVTINNYAGVDIRAEDVASRDGDRELIVTIDRRVARQIADPYALSSGPLSARGARPQMRTR